MIKCMEMKRVLLLLLMIIQSCFTVKAQMVRWVMQPVYDKIYMADGAPFIISDSVNTYSLWNLEGERIAVTQDKIHPFVEGYAITTKQGTDVVTGFFDMQGKHIAVNNYSLAYPDTYFSDGYLLLKFGSGYRIVNTSGSELFFGKYLIMYPFNKGYASCFTYESVEKRRNPYYTYITTDDRAVVFSFNDRVFDKTDVGFLSSINDEGKAIAVIKNKIFCFESANSRLTPVFATKDETNLKRQVSVEGTVNEYLLSMNDTFVIKGRGGKNEGNVVFYFDRLLRPTKIVYADRTEVFEIKKREKETYASSFSVQESADHMYGLKWDGKTILPPQFDEVGLCVNDLASVCTRGKWGMLTYDKLLKFRLIMHDGKDIAFRHKDVATTIKLELPAVISADKCRFDVGQEYGCTVDKMSLETKNTENGNYVRYKCTLSMPKELPDVITELQYPVRITYDGLQYPVVPIKTRAWHYKYINVDLDDSETTIEQGDVSFTINISADKQPGENDYPFEVDIKTDSLRTELVKISETRYKCKLYSLAEGVNNVNISILEAGCPPSVFPFEITYVKPVEKSKDQPEVKEAVKIEKKVNVRRPVQVDAPVLPI